VWFDEHFYTKNSTLRIVYFSYGRLVGLSNDHGFGVLGRKLTGLGGVRLNES